MNTRGTASRLRAAVLVAVLFGALPLPVVAAHVEAVYSFRDGAAFLSATGPVTADVRGTVLGVPFRQVRTGVASGATSWNISGGQLGLAFDDDDTSPSLDSVIGTVVLTRRAGAILIDFPLLQVGSLDPISLDLSFASSDDDLENPVIEESVIDAAGVTSLLVFEADKGLVAGFAGPLAGGGVCLCRCWSRLPLPP